MNTETVFDVVVLGGGLAGLSLSLQLIQKMPELRIAVIDKRSFPLPEAMGKVGESSVEIAAHYFDTVLGLKEHFENEQLPKLGLRYFLEFGSERDLHERLEVGNNRFAPTPSYQIDRGRLENHLHQCCIMRGVTIFEAASVRECTLDESGHTARFTTAGTSHTLSARWIVDASGRTSVLRKKLGLQEHSKHTGTSAWWRFSGEFRIDTWGDNTAWKQQNGADNARWFSTNHLMGQGYWVWIIPLSSSVTSFGIVADPSIHPFSELHTFDKALAWLKRHEPQCAEVIEANREHLLDFAGLKNYSHWCSQVFSPQRWAITGEAGIFIDPFYSPGSDFIAYANTYITDLVHRDFTQQEALALRCDLYNQLYLRIAHAATTTFHQQYPILGNALVLPIKVFWDWCFYWNFLARLFFEHKITDLRFISNTQDVFRRFEMLGAEMQTLFRHWNEVQRPQARAGFLDLAQQRYLFELNRSLLERDRSISSEDCFRAGLAQMESIAHEIRHCFTESTGAADCPADDSFPSDGPFMTYYRALREFIEPEASAQVLSAKPMSQYDATA